METYLEMRTVSSIQSAWRKSLLLLHPHRGWGRGAGERQRQSGDIRQTPRGVHGLLESPRLAELFWASELPYLPKTSRLVF